MTSGLLLDGRVPIWVDQLSRAASTDERAVVLVHEQGTSPTTVAPLADVLGGRDVFAPHLRGHGQSGRVRGGVYTTADLAADLVRVVRVIQGRVILVALGRSCLPAVLASAAEPSGVDGLVLMPGTAVIECSNDPRPSRRRWIAQARSGGKATTDVDGWATLPWPEPLFPDDRDEMWGALAAPVVWIGEPFGAWCQEAPVNRVVPPTGDLATDLATAIVSSPGRPSPGD